MQKFSGSVTQEQTTSLEAKYKVKQGVSNIVPESSRQHQLPSFLLKKGICINEVSKNLMGEMCPRL